MTMLRLGDGWPAPALPDPVEEDTKRQVDLDSLRYEQLMATVNALRAALLEMPAPVVNVSEPDLSAVVNAVNGLRPGATAEEIAQALHATLGGGDGPQLDETLRKLTGALETLDFRLKGLGNGGGSGGNGNVPPPLNAAPASDTGQAAVPVRIISQLGAGGGASGGLTNTELRASPVPVSGTVTITDGSGPVTVDGTVAVSNFPATQPVSGTFWQATQPVSLASMPTTPVRADPGVDVRAGRAFLVSSGSQTLAAAGNLRAVITNPGGSGKSLYIYRISIYATGAGVAHLYVNPTTGIPAASKTITNLLLGSGSASVGTFQADTSLATALSGGTDTGVDLGFPANQRTSLEFEPMILPAGTSLGVNVPFTGAATSILNVHWSEV